MWPFGPSPSPNAAPFSEGQSFFFFFFLGEHNACATQKEEQSCPRGEFKLPFSNVIHHLWTFQNIEMSVSFPFAVKAYANHIQIQRHAMSHTHVDVDGVQPGLLPVAYMSWDHVIELHNTLEYEVDMEGSKMGTTRLC